MKNGALRYISIFLLLCVVLTLCACTSPAQSSAPASDRAAQGFSEATGVNSIRLPSGYRSVSWDTFDDFVADPQGGVGFSFEHESYIGNDGLYSYASYIWNTCAGGVDANGIFSVKEVSGGFVKDTLFEGIEASYSEETGYSWFYYKGDNVINIRVYLDGESDKICVRAYVLEKGE